MDDIERAAFRIPAAEFVLCDRILMFEKLTPQMAAEMRAKPNELYRCSGSVALGVSTGFLDQPIRNVAEQPAVRAEATNRSARQSNVCGWSIDLARTARPVDPRRSRTCSARP